MPIAVLLLFVFSCFLLFGGFLLTLRFALPVENAIQQLKFTLVFTAAWLIATAALGHLGYIDPTQPLVAVIFAAVPTAVALMLAATSSAYILKALPVGIQLLLQVLRLLVGIALLLLATPVAEQPVLFGLGLVEIAFGVGALFVWQRTFNSKTFSLQLLQVWQVVSSITLFAVLLAFLFMAIGVLDGRVLLLEKFPSVWLLVFFYPCQLWLMFTATRKLYKHGLNLDAERANDPGSGRLGAS